MVTEVDEILTRQGPRDAACGCQGGEVLPADIVVSNADAGHTYMTTCLRNAPKKRRWTGHAA
jgi:phytoene desaturase